MVKISQMMEGDEMENRSISDIIEAYLKEIFGDDTQIEIRRSEIADHFNVVPSQINYVIKTRFTIQNGCTLGLTSYHEGAGVAGGTLYDCAVRSNHASATGGGAVVG